MEQIQQDVIEEIIPERKALWQGMDDEDNIFKQLQTVKGDWFIVENL